MLVRRGSLKCILQSDLVAWSILAQEIFTCLRSDLGSAPTLQPKYCITVAEIITPAGHRTCPTNLVNCPFDCAHERTKCPTRLVIVTVLRRCMKYLHSLL